jgi:hypothetical protein
VLQPPRERGFSANLSTSRQVAPPKKPDMNESIPTAWNRNASHVGKVLEALAVAD